MPAEGIALPTCAADVPPYWSSALWIQHMEKVREHRQQWNWDVAQRVSAIHASVSRIKMLSVNTSVKELQELFEVCKASLRLRDLSSIYLAYAWDFGEIYL